METIQLQATKRTEKANHVREKEAIPAILYGHGIAAESLALPYAAFVKVHHNAGESTLIDLVVDGAQPRKVLIHDIQYDPMSDRFLHVDLYEVRMTEKMKTKVPVRFVGEAPAVKEKGGVLVKNLAHLNVSCLPKDLVSEIVIQLQGLSDFGHSVYVKDIVPPAGITILDRPEEPVISVMRPKTEEELAKELAAEIPKEVKIEDVVKVQEKKKAEEGEEGAEEKDAKGGAAQGGKEEKKPPAKGKEAKK